MPALLGLSESCASYSCRLLGMGLLTSLSLFPFTQPPLTPWHIAGYCFPGWNSSCSCPPALIAMDVARQSLTACESAPGRGIRRWAASLREGDIKGSSMSEEERSHYCRVPVPFAVWRIGGGSPSLRAEASPLLPREPDTNSWASQGGTHVGKRFLCCFMFSSKGWSFMSSFLSLSLILDGTEYFWEAWGPTCSIFLLLAPFISLFLLLAEFSEGKVCVLVLLVHTLHIELYYI